jgi:hypothetical protein
MSRFEIVAGDFGKGRGSYACGTFTLPGKTSRGIEDVAAVEANATVVQGSWWRAAKDTLKGAATVAPVAVVAGAIFVAPLAAVAGTAALTGAAIGAAMGALGGGMRNRTLMQVTFRDGSGLIAIAEEHLPGQILHEAEIAAQVAARHRRTMKEVNPRGIWLAPGPALERPPQQIAPPVQALPAPAQTPAAEISVYAATGVLVSAASDAAAAATTATLDAAGDALGSAWSFVKRRKGASKDEPQP